ncbi:MAG: Bax inhibitor-1/YccA family protein [Deltaproteobacteria bacterium]|nr:Bax inhibitor-1/YccA family protein [Deltaproteobacteria bacterium]
MAMGMRTANPALRSTTFSGVGRVARTEEVMSIQGTTNKALLLLLLVCLTASWTWSIFFKSGNPAAVMPMVAVGAIGGFIVALVTVFRTSWSGVTAPLYALLEGLVIGGVSSIAEAQFPGIVIQAVALTFGTCFALLLAYKTRLIKATESFKKGVFAATGGIALFYIVTMVLGLFGVSVPLVYGAGPVGIVFSLVVVVIAALNLVLDFDFIEQGSLQGAPKYMEWYGAFALMVTLIWLYLEILRLLMKLRSRE